MNKLQLRPPSGATRPVELIQGRCFKKLGSSPTYTLKKTICTTIAPSTASITVDRVISTSVILRLGVCQKEYIGWR